MIFGIYNKVRQSPLAPSLLTKNNSAYKSRKHLGNFVLVQLLAGVEPEEGLQEVSLHVRASTQGLGGTCQSLQSWIEPKSSSWVGLAWLGLKRNQNFRAELDSCSKKSEIYELSWVRALEE